MSPRSPEDFNKIRKRSRQTIMEVALELFSNKGYHATSISQIAKVAGISKGLIYNYFDSKEALLRAIMMDAFEEGSELATNELNRKDAPHTRLKYIIEGFAFMIKNRTKHWKLLTALSFQDDANSIFLKELMPKKEVLIEQFVGLFEEMGFEQARQEALLAGAMLDGVGMHYMSLGEHYPIDEMIDLIIKKYTSTSVNLTK